LRKPRPWPLKEVWNEVKGMIHVDKEIIQQVSKLKYSGCESSILNAQEDKNNKLKKFQYAYETFKRTLGYKQGRICG
jgi:hypothetical protein